MSRSRFVVGLGFCFALGACGDKFVSGTAAGGSGGTSNSAGGDSKIGGQAEPGGSAGEDSAGAAGEAGSESVGVGGSNVVGGSGGLPGTAGGGASGGVGGSAPIELMLPRAGLLLWLRADYGVVQKDGLVQVWQDQSGNQTNATQAGPNVRPAYLEKGFNGRPTLEFDGQGQFLRLPDGFGDFSNGLTGLIVAKPTKSECSSMVEFSNGSEIDDIALSMWQDQWMYEVETPYIQTGKVGHDTFSLYAARHRAVGASEVRINGSTLGMLEMPLPHVPESGIRVNNFVGHTLYGGGCAYFEGQISEIIVYSRTLTNTELSAIEKYLDTHWALSEQAAPTP